MKNKKSFLFSCLALLLLVFAMSCSNPSAPEVKKEKEKNTFMPTQEQAAILNKYAGEWFLNYYPDNPKPADMILDINDKTIFMRDLYKDNGIDPRVELGDITGSIVDVDVKKNNIIAKTKSINGKVYFIIIVDESWEEGVVEITINVKEDSLDGKKFTDWLMLKRKKSFIE